MKKTILFTTFILLLSCGNHPEKNVDLVITNAKVYTLNWDNPSLDGTPATNAPFKNGKWNFDAEAIAIKNNLIQYVGSNDDIAAYIGKNTQVIDAKNAFVIPGLIESHGHLQEMGEKKESIN